MVTLVCKLRGPAATTDQDKKKRVMGHVKHWMMEPVLHQYTMTFKDWMDCIWPSLRLTWSWPISTTSRDADASGSDATLPMPGGDMMLYIADDPWALSSQDS